MNHYHVRTVRLWGPATKNNSAHQEVSIWAENHIEAILKVLGKLQTWIREGDELAICVLPTSPTEIPKGKTIWALDKDEQKWKVTCADGSDRAPTTKERALLADKRGIFGLDDEQLDDELLAGEHPASHEGG